MGTQPKPVPRIIIGPFEYDGSSGELRKHQIKLRLTGQALRILEVLLEHPNQVVGREELQQRLWNGTTFVDFEHGLNAAINKLRQTLGDSADLPRYVETLPGRGYRFIGALTYSPSGSVLEMVAPTSSDPSGSRLTMEPEEVLRSWRRFWSLPLIWRAAALMGLLLLGIAGLVADVQIHPVASLRPEFRVASYAIPDRHPGGNEARREPDFFALPGWTNAGLSRESVWRQSASSMGPVSEFARASRADQPG